MVISFTSAGIIKSAKCEEKIHILEITKTAVVTIKQRLIFTLASPEELIRALLQDNRFNKCDLFKNSMQAINNSNFETGWKEYIDQYNIFDDTETEVVVSLANILGCGPTPHIAI